MMKLSSLICLTLMVATASVASAQDQLCFSKVGLRPSDSSLYTIIEPYPARENAFILGTKNGHLGIYIQDSNGMMAMESTFLDVSSSILTGSERGLLGLAFHPDFASNGRVFVSTTCAASTPDCGEGDNAIDEYVVSVPSIANHLTVAPTRILTVAQPYENHNGGQLLFSPEGYLFIMIGDGGTFEYGQNRQSMLGKILRIDINNEANGKNYAIPASNPFVSDENTLDEIYALGLRNPWRCSFDREDRQQNRNEAPLYCGDVGQSRLEEIDIINKADNLGWGTYEGTSIFRSERVASFVGPHKEPAYEYRHVGSGFAVIGGYVYRQDGVNSFMSGHYLFADQYKGLKKASLSFSSVVDVNMRCASSSPYDCDSMGQIYSFGEGHSGQLFVAASSGIFELVDQSQLSEGCVAPEPEQVSEEQPENISTDGQANSAVIMRPLIGTVIVIIAFTAIMSN